MGIAIMGITIMGIIIMGIMRRPSLGCEAVQSTDHATTTELLAAVYAVTSRRVIDATCHGSSKHFRI